MDYLTSRQRLGSRIRRIRNEKDITQEGLAELVGKTPEHISLVERGERSPSFELLVDLANTFGITLSHLVDIDRWEQESVSSLIQLVPDSGPVLDPNAIPNSVEEPIKPPSQRKSDLERMQEAYQNVQALQELAREYGITDIFQDNGGKVLQLLIILGLRISPGREGNDATDADGNEYELKTINLALNRNRGITTHHHLTKEIVDKYRAVKAWYIATYEGIELSQVWKVEPSILEPLFQQWTTRLDENGNQPLNNPKIPIRYVTKGQLVYQNPDKYVQGNLL